MISETEFFDKFILGSVPVFERLMNTLWAPFVMSGDSIERKSIFFLEGFRQGDHRDSLCLGRLIVADERNLYKSVVITPPLIRCSDTLLISGIGDLTIRLDHIVISDVFDTESSLVTVFDCLEGRIIVSIGIVKLDTLDLAYESEFTL